MEWIKCSERMPEDGEGVLAFHIEEYQVVVCWFPEEEIFVGEYSRGKGWWGRDGDLEPQPSYTHWMPLPKPPTE